MGGDFTKDMRLYSILGCEAQGSGQLEGLSFNLRSTEGTLRFLELERMGKGSFCDEVSVAEGESVTYVEVTYSTKRINSFFAKLGKNKNILFGARQSGDKTQSWGFDDETPLMGLSGTTSSSGIKL